LATLNVTLEVELPLIAAGLKLVVMPTGKPVAESETDDENPNIEVRETVENWLRPW
jgi:hypothetical protein